VRVALARALSAAGAYAEAVGAYREAARLMPDDPEGWLRLADAHLNLGGDPQAAVEDVQVALRIDPESPRAYGLLGAALHAMGEHPEAVASFAEAVRLEPEFLAHRPALREMDAASRLGAGWPATADQPAGPGS
jgi:tetratricopeptide (TPR) repeat protein